jgi:hypothetical protein
MKSILEDQAKKAATSRKLHRSKRTEAQRRVPARAKSFDFNLFDGRKSTEDRDKVFVYSDYIKAALMIISDNPKSHSRLSYSQSYPADFGRTQRRSSMDHLESMNNHISSRWASTETLSSNLLSRNQKRNGRRTCGIRW